MMIAYFITFSTYGARLHGDDRGSVDRHNNQLGAPFLQPDAEFERGRRSLMKMATYSLDASRRAVVLAAICRHTGLRAWPLYTVHVRTNHVHVVLTAPVAPERVMNELKAYCSRALKEVEPMAHEVKRWTRHGSTRWLNTPESIRDAVRYSAFGQGRVMSLFVSPEYA